ncbi:MAG: AI-2E family transporter [Lachnospiraceae bacterium]|nr:AI-2E family transporter [Lachnospiraceae bacterium]
MKNYTTEDESNKAADKDIFSKNEGENKGVFRININNKYVLWGITAFLVFAAAMLLYYIMFNGSNIRAVFMSFLDILMPILFGLIMAYLLTPVLNFIEYRILIPLADRLGIKASDKRRSIIRILGIIVTALLFFLLIYSLAAMLLSQIVPNIINIVSNFDTYINNITKWLTKLLDDNPELSSNVTYMIDRYSGELEEWINTSVIARTSGIIKSVSLSAISGIMVLWDFIIGFVISIYVLASKEKFAGQAKKIVYSIFPKSVANNIISDFRFTHKTFIGFISGKVVDSIIIGMICFIGTTLMQTPYAALVSTVIGVTNIIPFFGPFIGAVPSAILVFVVDPSHPLNCVYFVLFILLLQQFDGNILGPRILGNSTGLAGFWIIFSITLFGGCFGITGMIVGVPIFAVFYSAVKSLVNAALARKNMPLDTSEYIDVGYVDDEGFHEYIPEYRLKKEPKAKNKPDNKEHDS